MEPIAIIEKLEYDLDRTHQKMLDEFEMLEDFVWRSKVKMDDHIKRMKSDLHSMKQELIEEQDKMLREQAERHENREHERFREAI